MKLNKYTIIIIFFVVGSLAISNQDFRGYMFKKYEEIFGRHSAKINGFFVGGTSQWIVDNKESHSDGVVFRRPGLYQGPGNAISVHPKTNDGFCIGAGQGGVFEGVRFVICKIEKIESKQEAVIPYVIEYLDYPIFFFFYDIDTGKEFLSSASISRVEENN